MMTMKTMYVADLSTLISTNSHTCREDDCLPDRTGGISVGVQTEVDSASYDRTARLGRLPDGEVESTLPGRWVSDDDGGFSGPEESCRDTTQSRAEQHEPCCRGHIVGIQSSAVQGVSNSLQKRSVILRPTGLQGVDVHQGQDRISDLFYC